MYPSKNIIENAVNSKDHTTLVAAVKAAGLVETLQGAGPFYLPNQYGFRQVARPLRPCLNQKQKNAHQYIDLPRSIRENERQRMTRLSKPETEKRLKTVSGGTLTAWMKGKDLYLTDEKGGSSKVTIADVNQSNGVIHVVDTVLMPKS
jgi:uncharacterized surface protein with fasciclin (FAS1) repeats